MKVIQGLVLTTLCVALHVTYAATAQFPSESMLTPGAKLVVGDSPDNDFNIIDKNEEAQTKATQQLPHTKTPPKPEVIQPIPQATVTPEHVKAPEPSKKTAEVKVRKAVVAKKGVAFKNARGTSQIAAVKAKKKSSTLSKKTKKAFVPKEVSWDTVVFAKPVKSPKVAAFATKNKALASLRSRVKTKKIVAAKDKAHSAKSIAKKKTRETKVAHVTKKHSDIKS